MNTIVASLREAVGSRVFQVIDYNVINGNNMFLWLSMTVFILFFLIRRSQKARDFNVSRGNGFIIGGTYV